MTNPINPTNDWLSYVPSVSTGGTTFTGFAPGSIQPSALFGTSPPAQPQAPWSMKPGSYYFEGAAIAGVFEIRRAERRSVMQMEGKEWTEQEEYKLVDKIWRNEYGEPWPGNTSWSYPDLDLDKLEPLSLRKYPLQPFKINYETYQEIKLRLYNTVISIKGHPYMVKAVGGDAPNWKMVVTDGPKNYVVNYNDLHDLRSIPPMYVTQTYTGWLCRHPGRVYQQGMNRSNTSLRSLDSTAVLAHFNPVEFMNGFRNKTNRKWEPAHYGLMKTGELPSLRLSDEIAVTTKKNHVVACYRGRPLGKIVDNTVKLFDEDDVLQQWIERSARDAGLELSA